VCSGLGQSASSPPDFDVASRSRMPAERPRGGVLPWLAAAASLFVAATAGFYAWSRHTEVTMLRLLVAQTSTRAETMRAELASMRQDSSRLLRIVSVIGAPDLMRADLAGQAEGAAATGRAFWSPANGLVFRAEHLPRLDAVHVYQLWVIQGSTPTSAGLLSLNPDGSASAAVALPPEVTSVDAVAVTLEPAGPEQPKPTGPAVLKGNTQAG
jgi:Anti-sigma-K factor rskA, C-terminal